MGGPWMLKSLNVNLMLVLFLHHEHDTKAYGREVLPLVRVLEAEDRGKDAEDVIGLTFTESRLSYIGIVIGCRFKSINSLSRI